MKKLRLRIALLFLVTSLGCQAQTVDTLIDVGTYRLHFHIIKGQGIPIIFESGGGDDGTVWNNLLNPLHESTGATLITYDRAGMGKSEVDTSKIDIVNEIKGFEAGLKKLGYFDNLFLVAHSFGGTYATLLSERNSKMIKGVTFIDCNLSCFNDEATAKKLKESYKDKMEYLKANSVGTYYLLLNYEKSNALFREMSFPATVPATVISSDVAPFSGNMSTRWKECQKLFGELPNHTYVLAKKSRHYIHKDNPALVIKEIVKLYSRVSLKEN